MAWVDIPRLKRSVVEQLREVMPSLDGWPEIRVDYAYPGEKHQRPVHVWLFNARCVSEYGAMGAGRKRRDQTWTFEVVIEAVHQGASVDGQGFNIGQERADAIVTEIAGAIDDYVATNPTLGQTQSGDVPVDHATFSGFTLEEGQHATGAATRGTCAITIRIRPK